MSRLSFKVRVFSLGFWLLASGMQSVLAEDIPPAVAPASETPVNAVSPSADFKAKNALSLSIDHATEIGYLHFTRPNQALVYGLQYSTDQGNTRIKPDDWNNFGSTKASYTDQYMAFDFAVRRELSLEKLHAFFQPGLSLFYRKSTVKMTDYDSQSQQVAVSKAHSSSRGVTLSAQLGVEYMILENLGVETSAVFSISHFRAEGDESTSNNTTGRLAGGGNFWLNYYFGAAH